MNEVDQGQEGGDYSRYPTYGRRNITDTSGRSFINRGRNNIELANIR